MSRYNIRLYVDDTGTKEQEATGSRLFAYGGIAIRQSNEAFVENRLLAFVRNYFPEIVELKSRWFRMHDLRQEHYLVPYGISLDRFDQFSRELFDLLCHLPIRCIGVVVDKIRQSSAYSVRLFAPSAVCYDLFLQRAANFCSQYKGQRVDIFVDDISGKNPKGHKWEDLLLKQHASLLKGRSPFYKTWKSRSGMDYSKINNTLIFLDSTKSVFIQIADLCAYNVMRQAKDHWGNFDGSPFYHGYSWIKPIMHRDPDTGRIGHYGALCFPD